jgi:hypothetical protein
VKVKKVECSDVTCSAVCFMSTDELHELVYAPHKHLPLKVDTPALQNSQSLRRCRGRRAASRVDWGPCDCDGAAIRGGMVNCAAAPTAA